jgi:hypothetical protein
MSNIEVTTGKISDPQSSSFNQLTDKPSPGAPTKAGKSKRSGTKESRRAQKASRSTSRPAQAGSKQEFVIEMLRRQSGVSIDDIVFKTGWQPHSVRGFLSGVVRRKLKLSLVSEVRKDGVRRYHVASSKPSKG